MAPGGDGVRKKRPLLGSVPAVAEGPSTAPKAVAPALAVLEEGDEGLSDSEEEEGAEVEEAQGGPTPQRQRREGRR